MTMEIAELDAFKAIVDYGSVTQAAIRLNRAQSSISFRIKTLESRLDAKLFERSGRGITMTAQGKELYTYASQILELVARAQASLSQAKTETRVRLGVIENLSITRQNLLQGIVANTDGLAVDISIGNTQSLLNDLEADKLDAVIVGAGFAPAHYRRVTLFNDPLALIYSATQPAIQDLKAFSGQVFLVNSRRSASQRNLDELFLTGSITPKKIIECGSYPLLFSNVINGMGVALVPLSLIDSCCDNEQVQTYRLNDSYGSLTTEFVFFDHPGKPAPKALAQCVLDFENPDRSQTSGDPGEQFS
ncbi:LysR family transcriptional regulator [Pseudomonas sp. TH03]|uniref:LysR family transcriptional regulator n=1 Tax=Pseudomonas sp. TH03 TaxID=2796369 RepID=UPI00191469D8|nr:LysR family transcriptional regulator [Pseudomonas sp. TH03]MBK5551153.1 LysR family transcriptional regulator [Pseudomonas sp. TH03]